MVILGPLCRLLQNVLLHPVCLRPSPGLNLWDGGFYSSSSPFIKLAKVKGFRLRATALFSALLQPCGFGFNHTGLCLMNISKTPFTAEGSLVLCPSVAPLSIQELPRAAVR